MIFKNYWKLHLAFVFTESATLTKQFYLGANTVCVYCCLITASSCLGPSTFWVKDLFFSLCFLLCLFTLQVKDLLISLCFLLLSFFFPWTAFIFQEILKHFFLNVADHLPFKVMAPNNPLPNNTQNLQSYCTLCIK